MGASSLYRNKTPLGDYHRRMSAKYRGKGASLATGHKIGQIIFKMLEKEEELTFKCLLNPNKNIGKVRSSNLKNNLPDLKKLHKTKAQLIDKLTVTRSYIVDR